MKPKPVRRVHVAGGEVTTAARVIEFMRSLDLKPVLGQRNQASVAADWRTLADLYNHSLPDTF